MHAPTLLGMLAAFILAACVCEVLVRGTNSSLRRCIIRTRSCIASCTSHQQDTEMLEAIINSPKSKDHSHPAAPQCWQGEAGEVTEERLSEVEQLKSVVTTTLLECCPAATGDGGKVYEDSENQGGEVDAGQAELEMTEQPLRAELARSSGIHIDEDIETEDYIETKSTISSCCSMCHPGPREERMASIAQAHALIGECHPGASTTSTYGQGLSSAPGPSLPLGASGLGEMQMD